MRTLRIAAAAEAVSLVVLLGNLLTVHAAAVSSLAGPLHGSAYLLTIATAAGARRYALIPGIGALLALRHLRSAPEPGRPPA
jgi:hypothetical protein